MAKILIIDDEKSIRSTLKEILEYEKYTIEEAEDGEAGLEALKKKDFDVVLCDIKMPKMDGLQLLEQFGQIGKDTPFYNDIRSWYYRNCCRSYQKRGLRLYSKATRSQ